MNHLRNVVRVIKPIAQEFNILAENSDPARRGRVLALELMAAAQADDVIMGHVGASVRRASHIMPTKRRARQICAD